MLSKEKIELIQNTYCSTNDEFWKSFNALGHCVRYRIVKILLNDPFTCVSDLARICQVSTAAISQHLKILEQARVIERKAKGKLAFYTLSKANKHVSKLFLTVNSHMQGAQR